MASVQSHTVLAGVVVVFLGSVVVPSHALTAIAEAPTDDAAQLPSPYGPPFQPVVIVEGVIYCKSCRLKGYNPSMDASPLPGATARLVCDGGEKVVNVTGTATDGNGYFLVMLYDLASFRRRRCRVYHGTSPTPCCSTPVVPMNNSAGLRLVKESRPSLPAGVRGVYTPTSALFYGPVSGGHCPPY